jgi:hypothetical protein
MPPGQDCTLLQKVGQSNGGFPRIFQAHTSTAQEHPSVHDLDQTTQPLTVNPEVKPAAITEAEE